MLRRHLLLGTGAALLAPAVARGQAQRPLRIVVPFVAGGAVDSIGRLLADRLPAHLNGQAVTVENRAGAAGVVGANHVARSAPDGNTIGILDVAMLCAFPTLYERLPFDPQRDFTPVTQISRGALLCAVNADIARRRQWGDFAAMIRWARANPNGLKGASTGDGTTSHLLISAIGQLSGAELTHVPYRGGAPALQDLLGGIVDMMFDAPNTLLPHIAAGRLRALAVSTAEPFPLIPGVPGLRGFASVGVGDLDITTWHALMAPPNTPPVLVQRLHEAIVAAAREEAFVARFRQFSLMAVTSESPAAMAELMQRDTPPWSRLVEMSGARLTV